MAPPRMDHTIDRTPEYEKFIQELTEYHAKRGTSDVFEPTPKVGILHVDLLKLFKLIMEHGGYDKVSDEKLAWRRMASILGLFSHNEASTAFNLKTVYYKNLAAYEISTVHKKEPPPPSILEYITAKGGSLLTRTLENYRPRESSSLAEPRRQDTPSKDRTDGTPTSGERAARFLRQNPAQRVPFQPDTHPTRTRHVSTPAASTPSGTAASAQSHHVQASHTPSVQTPVPLPVPRGASSTWVPQNGENTSLLINGFEPRPPIVIPLRAVDTPGNNPIEFARRQRLLRSAQAAQTGLAARTVVPGSKSYRSDAASSLFANQDVAGFEGPSIYIRCLCSLRSQNQEEQAFALNHLVKISYERGDKYKFESFPGLADGLVEKALEVGSMFYHVSWSISYTGVSSSGGELDGINGTSDILERIASLVPKDVQDTLQPPDFQRQMIQVVEATLTIRNMVMLPDNAIYMAEYPPLKDLLCILLRLPPNESVVELKHFALDIAEQVTPWLVLDSEDPLYRVLVEQLDSNDRGTILTALRAVTRISVNLSVTNKLADMPHKTLRTIMSLLLLNDDELIDACLDFLYMYTAVVANVNTLVQACEADHLISHLVRLLAHNARRVHKEIVVEKEKRTAPSETQVVTPPDIVERLVGVDEPERCHSWLRSVFEEDPDATITQLAVWQSYQSAFSAALGRVGKQTMNAAEFIRGISQVYTSAMAKILRDGDQQKFIIQGLRARERPVDPSGTEYWACEWRTSGARCGTFSPSVEELLKHIFVSHLGVVLSDSGSSLPNEMGDLACYWAGCRKHRTPTSMHYAELSRHIVTNHIKPAQAKRATANVPTTSSRRTGSVSSVTNPGRSRWVVPARTISIPYEETPVVRDERNPNAPPQPAGIPFSAVLVLRNIARNADKTEANEDLRKKQEEQAAKRADEVDGLAQGHQETANGETASLKERLFLPVTPRLFEIMSQNRVLVSCWTYSSLGKSSYETVGELANAATQSPYITTIVDFKDDE